MYKRRREETANTLSSMEYYSSKTDLRTSRTTELYLSLTVHFIDSKWKLSNACLETSYFPEDHTGKNIANGLIELLQSWDLDEKIKSV